MRPLVWIGGIIAFSSIVFTLSLIVANFIFGRMKQPGDVQKRLITATIILADLACPSEYGYKTRPICDESYCIACWDYGLAHDPDWDSQYWDMPVTDRTLYLVKGGRKDKK